MAKTVLITGASRGIGAEIAKSFAKDGCRVVINYLNSEEQAKEVANEVVNLGGTPLLVKADVSKSEQAKFLVEQTVKVFGNIDVLVCNAGVCEYGLLIDTPESSIDKVIDVNLKGTIFVCKFASEYMMRNMSGKIINISSIWGVSGASNESVYSASKAGIIGFTKALAKELEFSNISVNAVIPGVIRTDMVKDFSDSELEEVAKTTKLKKIGLPKDVAKVVEYIVSDNANNISGECFEV